MPEIKEGSIVTFKNPEPSEVGNYANVFKVLEMRGDRVLVEMVWSKDTIKPTFVYLLSDMRRSFIAHFEVEVPEFVDFDVWEDSSWHHDITASVQRRINDTYNICVWVYDPPSNDEIQGLDPKEYYIVQRFAVTILDNKNGWMTYSKCMDTEDEAQEVIKSVLANHEAFIKEVGWS